MRIDVVTIFPDYLAPLGLSLPGKAQAKGLLDVEVHDLRQWTTDRHHTVDDTPYGGGAGMVMKPEPWGQALEAVARGATIVFTTPSGEPFTQALAHELSTHEHLVFACGRYEGIDQRVIEHAATLGTVREVSLGDYVLNGGEVAALAITEAVVRLLPGFMGNAESLVEESHADGLLEYPVYTKPASWQGRDVPEVLLSGDHGRIAAWRREQAERRTAERRPDLLPATGGCRRPRRPRRAPGRAGRRRRALHPAAGLLAPGAPGQPGRRHPGAARVARRRTPRAGGVDGHGRARAPVSGRLVGAVRGRRRRARRVGHRPDHGRARPAGPRPGARAPRAGGGARSADGDDVRALHRGRRRRDNLRMYKKAGFRLRPDRVAPPGAVVLTKRGRAADFTLTSALWQTSALVRSRPGSPGAPSQTRRGPAAPHLPQGARRPASSSTSRIPSPTKIPRLTCGTREEHVMTNVIAELGNSLKRDDVPAFRAGDTIKVHVKVIEGSRSRVQVFQGVVIRIHGSGVGRTFTVRKVSFGVGVERTFPLNSPIFEKIEVVTRGDVRRAKLYYLRNLRGKAAKIKERREA